MTKDKVGTILKIALGVVAALFIGLGIFSYTSIKKKNIEKNDLIEENNKVKNDLIEEKTKVLEELNQMAAQYDVAMSDNTIANENIVIARERIEGLIDSLKSSENSVKSLWRYKTKYLSLQKEMDLLLTENDKLKVENKMLTTTLDDTNLKLQERAVYADSVLVQNTALANVVESVAVLSANSLNVSGIIERSSGKLIPTERAGRSDKIKVCFTVPKNKLVEPGDKEFFVQVVDPKNNILGVNEQVTFGEETLNYSLISKFNYENKNLPICEYLSKKNKKDDFIKGIYKVSVFNGKELLTSSLYTMK